ncbi:MAG: hypothetical protein HOJ15_01325 [Candidatus Jacksonbacteria bacterium]|jgi:hypothetical protein|nr:hypothetical protein [Candidatus Jacksonbacteria bacterium]MBT6034300.1 hypothetical protein [Candidatus Jacksonbacteria bacterium]MBT6301051.1 hypothetical protein [Candidatus Jacksonbacteria bacterium]MBT6757802.1 hypothetical protein [Candidatus Jacksonbacteria bacterium]MBT6955363.1 hypothetical protein [Candidatus Jacksonbacteria bacterium]
MDNLLFSILGALFGVIGFASLSALVISTGLFVFYFKIPDQRRKYLKMMMVTALVCAIVLVFVIIGSIIPSNAAQILPAA